MTATWEAQELQRRVGSGLSNLDSACLKMKRDLGPSWVVESLCRVGKAHSGTTKESKRGIQTDLPEVGLGRIRSDIKKQAWPKSRKGTLLSRPSAIKHTGMADGI